MTSELKVDKITPASGTSTQIGDSGDTFTVPTGAGLTVTDEVKTNKISPASGTAFTLGDSGDTFTIPSGVTFANSGTATGFGGNTGNVYWGATMTTDRTIPHNTNTLMHFNDEYYDSGSVYDPSNYKATIPSGGAGFYLVGWSFNIQHPSDNSRVQNPHGLLYKNGSGFHLGSGAYGNQPNFRLDNSNYGHRECNVQRTFFLQLADSDYLQVYAYNSMDNNTNGVGRAEYSSFWGVRLT